MKKIKFLIASMIGAIALVFAAVIGVKVNAEGTAEEFSANTLTIGTVNKSTKIYDGTLFDFCTGSGTGAYVSYIGGEEYNKSTKYSSTETYTATSTDSSKTYTKAVLPSSTTSDDKAFEIKSASSAITVTVYFTICDSNFCFETDKNGNAVAESYAKSGDIIISGTTTEISGNKARTTAYIAQATIAANSTATVYSSANRVVVFGIVAEEATVTTHDVTYMDGSTTLKQETLVDGATITYTPVKYGYDFDNWCTDVDLTNAITSTYTLTADVTLYAKWTEWDYAEFSDEYTLTSDTIAKIATGIDGALTADLALTPSIYTLMTGAAMTTTNVTLPGADSAAQNPCFNTNGGVSTSAKGLKFTAPCDGTFTVYIGVGGGDSRSVIFSTDGTTALTPAEGTDALSFDGTSYEPVALNFEITEGTTYYLGGSNGVRIYYVSIDPAMNADTTVAVDAEINSSYDTVRFIGTLTGITDLANIDTIELVLLKDNAATSKKIYLTTCYTSIVNASKTYAAADNTYYVLFRLTGADTIASSTITKSIVVTFTDGSTTTCDATEFVVPAAN